MVPVIIQLNLQVYLFLFVQKISRARNKGTDEVTKEVSQLQAQQSTYQKSNFLTFILFLFLILTLIHGSNNLNFISR